ncbi:hypothetical protein DFJ74DRAFT_703294 [Hyaloraphidium curvatum]|nr:hypothetical protein DFJ74DRAFT_703294 [Hyaloraphidium curvatum]
MSHKAVCVYHWPCPDGIFAALSVRLALPSARFQPLAVTARPEPGKLALSGDETVYFVDFTGPKGFVEAVAAAVPRGKVVVLDHHKTAMENLVSEGAELAALKGSFGPSGPAVPQGTVEAGRYASLAPANVELNIDMLRSGATMARDYFRPAMSEATARIVCHIEDADLWNWKLEGSKEFSAGFGKLDLDLSTETNPGIFDALLALDPDALMAQGKEEMAAIKKLVDSALAKAFLVRLPAQPPKECMAVRMDTAEEADAFAKHRSQLGNELAEMSRGMGLPAIGVVAYFVEPGKTKVSFRSIGKEDTTAVSQMFGGGGHANASSCVVDSAEFERWTAA